MEFVSFIRPHLQKKNKNRTINYDAFESLSWDNFIPSETPTVSRALQYYKVFTEETRLAVNDMILKYNLLVEGFKSPINKRENRRKEKAMLAQNYLINIKEYIHII